MVEDPTQLTIEVGKERAFEKEFAEVGNLILQSPGCLAVDLRRSVDKPGAYLLQIEWNELTDHTEVFRDGPIRDRFSAPIRKYSADKAVAVHYDPEPLFRHVGLTEGA